MEAYLCVYICLIYPNFVFSFSTSLGTFAIDSGGPVVILMNGNEEGTNEKVLHAQGTNDDQVESNVIKPTWVKKADRPYDSNKPLISNYLDGHKGAEIKGTNQGKSERSVIDNDEGIVTNIGEPRQPGSIFFNPNWRNLAKNPIYDNNGFYQPDKNVFHNQPGNNAFNNQPGQTGIYTASKANIVKIGKGNLQLWKPQYVGNKGSSYVGKKNPGHTTFSGSKGYKQGHNFQIGKSYYSLSRDTLNSNNPKDKKKVPYNLQNSPYGRSGSFSLDVINKDPFKPRKKYPKGKAVPLRNGIIYSKHEGPIKNHQENQVMTNWLPNILMNAFNSSSFEEANGNDAEKPSDAKIRVHPYRHKRNTNKNDNERTPTGQLWVWNTNSPKAGDLSPVRHSTTTDKGVGAPKGHSWNQKDLKYSGNMIHPARHSLNPIILGAKGLNTFVPETLNTDQPGGRNTVHPDEQSNGNSANQNLEVARNIHYPDIAGMKNVHPKDLLHYLRRLRVLVEPSAVRTGVEEVRNATKFTPPVQEQDSDPIWENVSKWGGILFRSSPENGTRSRFMAFPLGPSNILRYNDDSPKYKFHFGGILWFG